MNTDTLAIGVGYAVSAVGWLGATYGTYRAFREMNDMYAQVYGRRLRSPYQVFATAYLQHGRRAERLEEDW